MKNRQRTYIDRYFSKEDIHEPGLSISGSFEKLKIVMVKGLVEIPVGSRCPVWASK